MEVHHHPKVEKKSFKEYFLEFIMIFLAVSLGFFAESLRENLVERHREKEYVKSFAEDIEDDVKTLHKDVEVIKKYILSADSLKYMLSVVDKNKNINEIYYLSRWLARFGMASLNERTIIQLRNAGGMRLIKNKKLSDGITAYYQTNSDRESLSTRIEHRSEQMITSVLHKMFYGVQWDELLDSNIALKQTATPLSLKSLDPDTINEYIFLLSAAKSLLSAISDREKILLTNADFILQLIENDYNQSSWKYTTIPKQERKI